MKNRKIVSLLGTVATSVCVILVSGNAANAGTLRNGWNYATDSFTDSTDARTLNPNRDGYRVGGTVFEIYGMAIKQDADNIYVALNANLPRGGARYPESNTAYFVTDDGNIGWGDLFFNFSGQNLSTASANRSLFGIRFGVPSNSGVSTTGVYRNVKAKSVAVQNKGWETLNDYLTKVRENDGNPSAGDLNLSADESYFSQDNLTSIDTGDKIGDITVLNSGELSRLGLDFGTSGSQTFGFKFAKSLLPTEEFIASLVTECFNDSIALRGTIESQPVPEPSGILGITALGLLFATSQLHKRCKNSSVK
jgi:hypothetical protein